MKKPGEKGPFGKGLLLPSPGPPPLIPPNILTGGEAARREFVPAEDLDKMIAPSKYLPPSPFRPIFSDGLVVSG